LRATIQRTGTGPEFTGGKQLHLTGRRDRNRASGNTKDIMGSFSIHAAIIPAAIH